MVEEAKTNIPRAKLLPVPMWLLLGLAGLLLGSGWYLATYFGTGRNDVRESAPTTGNTPGEKKTPKIDPVALGERLYRFNCMACHQTDGRGQPGQYPALAGSEWVNGPDYRLARIVLHGLTGPVTVRGQTYNGNMPPHGEKLSDMQIAAILTYLRQAWGHQAGAVAVEVVTAVRQAADMRNHPWDMAELLALTAPDPLPATTPQP